VAEDVSIPLSVLLAFALGLALGILGMILFGQQTQVLGGVAGTPSVVIQRDDSGRIVSIREGR